MITLAADVRSGLRANVAVGHIAHIASVVVGHNRVEIGDALEASVIIATRQAGRKAVELDDRIGNTSIVDINCIAAVAHHADVGGVAGHAVGYIANYTSSDGAIGSQGSKSDGTVSANVVC